MTTYRMGEVWIDHADASVAMPMRTADHFKATSTLQVAAYAFDDDTVDSPTGLQWNTVAENAEPIDVTIVDYDANIVHVFRGCTLSAFGQGEDSARVVLWFVVNEEPVEMKSMHTVARLA